MAKDKVSFEVGTTVKCKGFGLGVVKTIDHLHQYPLEVEFLAVIMRFTKKGKMEMFKNKRLKMAKNRAVKFGYSPSLLETDPSQVRVYFSEGSAKVAAEQKGVDIVEAMVILKY